MEGIILGGDDGCAGLDKEGVNEAISEVVPDRRTVERFEDED